MDREVTEQTNLSGRRGTSSGRKSIRLPITRTDEKTGQDSERDSDKLVYTSEGGDTENSDTVKIVLSTLPPVDDTVDSLGHTGTVSPKRTCMGIINATTQTTWRN